MPTHCYLVNLGKIMNKNSKICSNSFEMPTDADTFIKNVSAFLCCENSMLCYLPTHCRLFLIRTREVSPTNRRGVFICAYVDINDNVSAYIRKNKKNNKIDADTFFGVMSASVGALDVLLYIFLFFLNNLGKKHKNNVSAGGWHELFRFI